MTRQQQEQNREVHWRVRLRYQLPLSVSWHPYKGTDMLLTPALKKCMCVVGEWGVDYNYKYAF